MSKKKKKQRIAERQQEKEEPQKKVIISPVAKTPLRIIVLFCIAVFLAGFLVYANTLKSDFIWDDEYLIMNNSQIKSFSHLPNVFKTYVGYGSENINNFYRPMQEISNMINFHFCALKPFGYHLTNVVLHALTAVMVMILIYSLSGNAVAGLIGALFFAIHPVHTEAIAYVAGRADPLYSFFMLLSLVLFIWSVRDADRGPMSHIFLYFASFVTFLISLLSKEMVMVMPLLMFLYMFYYFRGTEKNKLFRIHFWRWIPFAVVVVYYGYLRATVLSFKDIAPQSAFFQIPFPFRLLTFFRTVGEYFRMLVLPTDLHMERTLRVTGSFFDSEALAALVMMAGIGWLIWWTYKKGYRTVSFAMVWFFVNLLPVSNIFPINSFLAEHWIYMACVGPLMLVGLLYARFWHAIPPAGRSLRIGFVLAVVFPLWIYSDMTIVRNKDWKDEISFFNATLKYHPRNTRLYLNLGNTYYEKGDIDNAVKQYEKCIELDKNYAVAYGNIGSAYLNKGDANKAEEYLAKAVALKDNYPIAHYNMGIIYFQRKEYDKSIASLNKATDQLPQLYQAWNMKARAYVYMGRVEDAKNAFTRSLEIYPAQDNVRKSLEKLNSFVAGAGAGAPPQN